jgi:hypothetical protein
MGGFFTVGLYCSQAVLIFWRYAVPTPFLAIKINYIGLDTPSVSLTGFPRVVPKQSMVYNEEN